jgi:hypothetical protein
MRNVGIRSFRLIQAMRENLSSRSEGTKNREMSLSGCPGRCATSAFEKFSKTCRGIFCSLLVRVKTRVRASLRRIPGPLCNYPHPPCVAPKSRSIVFTLV